MDDLKEIGLKNGLMSYEKVKNIHLHSELFSLENGLATPTLKLKRINLRMYFQNIVANLYAEADAKKAKL
jgi:long-chain acyl-CoA synthetase